MTIALIQKISGIVPSNIVIYLSLLISYTNNIKLSSLFELIPKLIFNLDYREKYKE